MKILLKITLILGLVSSVYAQKVIKLAHLNKNDPFDNPTGAMVTVFKSIVETGTNGSIKVELFPSGQLGKDSEVIQQTKMGVIQSSINSSGGFASVYPLMSIIDVPFIFDDVALTYDVFDGKFGELLKKDMEETTGIKVLGFGDSGGLFHITNSKRPIGTLDDMKNLKIRTMGLETHKGVINSLGASATAVSWSEVYVGLQTGLIDGEMNPIPVIAFAKFDEVQKYLTLTGHLFAPYVWTMNQKFYDSLTEEEKTVVSYAYKSAIVAGRGIGRIIEASDRGLAELKKNMKVNSLSTSEKEKFREKSLPVIKNLIEEKYGEKGTRLMNEFIEAVNEVKNKK